ncbi:hypothetical protein TNCV_657701 [Trichonephila clavipes]|nr:hypothetical protein TNCV_657701 [Trichonephila clavipes]
MVSLGHPSLPPTDLGRLDDEEASPEMGPLKVIPTKKRLDVMNRYRCPCSFNMMPQLIMLKTVGNGAWSRTSHSVVMN